MKFEIDEPLRVPALTREMDISDMVVERKAGGPVQLRFSASSEYPVERFFGKEILDHSIGAIRLDRAQRGAVPLLFNHNMDDPIGMVDDLSPKNGRLMTGAHLFDGLERASQVESMISGGLRNVSLRYRIHKVESMKDGSEVVREWEPLEVSIVTVPADPTVGIGRAQKGEEEFEVRRVRASDVVASKSADTATTQEIVKMDNEIQDAPAGETAVRAEVVFERQSAVAIEVNRKRAIDNICKVNNLDDKVRNMWIGQGLSIEEISDDLVKLLSERGKTNPSSVAKMGLSNPEKQRYSMARAIMAASTQNWTKAGFELELSRAIQEKMNVTPEANVFYVPFDLLHGQRDLTVASAGAGGYLVGTQNMGFVDFLRNRSVAYRMGAMQMDGLVGNVTIPRQSAAATGYWLANEATSITESQQTFVQIALTPKNVGAYTEISRQLLLQSSPSAEQIVSNDLASVVATAVDLAALEGSGAAGQPTGISATGGIGSVTGTSLASAGVIEFQTDVAGNNVIPSRPGYVTTPAVAGLLMARPELPSTGTTRLWGGNVYDGSLFGIPAMTTNQVTAASMIFGDWNELVIGTWGVLSVEVNPFANFAAGIIGVRAMYTIDVAVRRAFAFSRATSIT